MIKIGFTGDFCPWLRVEQQFKTNNWKPLFHAKRFEYSGFRVSFNND
jgi:hypothetical protein